MPGPGNICFISYRDPGHDAARATVHAFADTLRELLAAWVPDVPVYFAATDLRAGARFENEIPAALCQSATFLMFYAPAYFDPAHSYCGREYVAMLEIEKRRGADFSRSDLILPVAYRGPGRVPDEIRNSRQMVTLEEVTCKADFRRSGVREKMRILAQQIYERYEGLTTAGWIPKDCGGFALPTDSDVRQKLSLLHSPQAFPGR